MINAGIVGATGYTGEMLIEILLRHPSVRITHLSAKIDEPQVISEIYPKFKNRIGLVCGQPDEKEIAAKCDLVFLALPHTVSLGIVPGLIRLKKKVIDLSADYRLQDADVYRQYYNVRHNDPDNLALAVYGLPEIYRAKIKTARLIANPGCYPTAAIVALAPLLAMNMADLGSIIIDAKSGVTGAGRKIAQGFLFTEINEDFKAYKVGAHQHAPEINQELSKLSGVKPRLAKGVEVNFVPHLLPLNRGILETIYLNKAKPAAAGKQGITGLYRKFYKNEPFVRIRQEGDYPRIKDVAGTNFCDICIKDCGRSLIIVAAIDNLLKGAAGQAVQNMNIMCGYPETLSLL